MQGKHFYDYAVIRVLPQVEARGIYKYRCNFVLEKSKIHSHAVQTGRATFVIIFVRIRH